jgi:hypothetical protein
MGFKGLSVGDGLGNFHLRSYFHGQVLPEYGMVY